MGTHLVLGAGSAGREIGRHLVEAGHEVVMVSRSGRRGVEGARSVAVDVRDAEALAHAARGVTTIVNALNPAHYFAWQREWPPLAASVRAAARSSAADVVVVGNLYGYGRVDAPMTEQSPLRPTGAKGAVRVQMWESLLADHRAGLYRVAELRGSDYTGANADSSVLNGFIVAPVARGRRAIMPMGRLDVAHSWTDVADLGRLAAALLTTGRDGDWGRAWHVPTSAPRTVEEVADDVTRLCGAAPARLRVLPSAARWALSLVVPTVWALNETAHQFTRPFVLDSSAAQERFGLAPTPWEDTLRAAIAAVAPADGREVS